MQIIILNFLSIFALEVSFKLFYVMEKVCFIVEQICGSLKDVKYKIVLERECEIPLDQIGDMMFALHRLFDSMRHRVIVKIDNQFDVTDI